MANQIKLNLGSSLSDLRSTASLFQQLHDSKIKNQMLMYDYFDKRATDEINNITNDFKNIDYVKGLIDNGTYDKVSQERYKRAEALAQKYGKQTPLTAKQYMEKEFYDDVNNYIANVYKAGMAKDKGAYDMATTLYTRKWDKKYTDALFATDFANQQRDSKFNLIAQEQVNKYMMNAEPEQYVPDSAIVKQIEELNKKLNDSNEPFKQLEENFKKEGADSNDVNNYEAAKAEREGWTEEIKNLTDKLKSDEDKWKQEHEEPNSALESINQQLGYMNRTMNQTTPISIDLMVGNLAKNAWDAGNASYTAAWDLQNPNPGEAVTKIFNTLSKDDIDKFMLSDDEEKKTMIQQMVNKGVFRSLPDSYEQDILNNPNDWISFFRKGDGYKQQFADWASYMKYYPEFRLAVSQQMQNFIKTIPVTPKTDVLGLTRSLMSLIKDIYQEVPEVILDDNFFDMFSIYVKEELEGKFDDAIVKQALNETQLQLKKDKQAFDEWYKTGLLQDKADKTQLGYDKLNQTILKDNRNYNLNVDKLNHQINKDNNSQDLKERQFAYKQEQDANKATNGGQPIQNAHFGYYDGKNFYNKKGQTLIFTDKQLANIQKNLGDYNIANIVGYLDNTNNSLKNLVNNSLTNEGKSEMLKYYRTLDSNNKTNVWARTRVNGLNARYLINEFMKSGIGTNDDGHKRQYTEYNIYQYLKENLPIDNYTAATIAHKVNETITNNEINAINARQNYL